MFGNLRVYALFPSIVRMNAAIRKHDPDLWQEIKKLPPSIAWTRICSKFGFERLDEQTVTGAAHKVCDYFGAKHE